MIGLHDCLFVISRVLYLMHIGGGGGGFMCMHVCGCHELSLISNYHLS